MENHEEVITVRITRADAIRIRQALSKVISDSELEKWGKSVDDNNTKFLGYTICKFAETKHNFEAQIKK